MKLTYPTKRKTENHRLKNAVHGRGYVIVLWKVTILQCLTKSTNLGLFRHQGITRSVWQVWGVKITLSADVPISLN